MIPKDVTIYEHDMASLWFDSEGILYARAKSGHRNEEGIDDYFRFLSKITGGNKVRVVSDITDASPMDSHTRAHAAKLFPQLFLALALVSQSHNSRLMGKTFIELSDQPYPTAIFEDELEAVKWLMTIAKPLKS